MSGGRPTEPNEDVIFVKAVDNGRSVVLKFGDIKKDEIIEYEKVQEEVNKVVAIRQLERQWLRTTRVGIE